MPAKVFESNLPRLLSGLARLDRTQHPLTLRFEQVEYWIPSAVVAICSMVNRWTEQSREVYFDGLQNCPAVGYLQRVDFFDQVGLHLPEKFTRHDPGTSFVEIQSVYPSHAKLKDPLARRLAECLAGTQDSSDDVLRFSEFALGEVVANCQQHAQKPGFVSAQYVRTRNRARIGVADYGIGIRESFRMSGSPHYIEGMTDGEALEVAMRPWVSSKRHLKTGPYGEPPNRGIGLKMIQHMIGDCCGELFIASGDAWRFYKGNTPVVTGNLAEGLSIPGTVVSIGFDRGQIADYREVLATAQKAVNLTPDPDDDIFFS